MLAAFSETGLTRLRLATSSIGRDNKLRKRTLESFKKAIFSSDFISNVGFFIGIAQGMPLCMLMGQPCCNYL